jgi:hypothetical protein
MCENVLRSRAGFGIIEALVASALIGALALVLSQVIINMARGQKSVFSAAQNSDEANLLRLTLDNNDRCKNAFKDANGENIKLDPSLDQEYPVEKIQIDSTGGGGPDLLVSETTNKRTLKISLKKRNPSELGTDEYLYDVKLAFNTPNTYPPSRTIEIPFKVELNVGLDVIQSCSFRGGGGGGGGQLKPEQFTTENKSLEKNAGKVVAECPEGTIRTGCSGSRAPNNEDNCKEDNCGLVGIRPVGVRGCEVNVDGGKGTNPTAYAYCFDPNK